MCCSRRSVACTCTCQNVADTLNGYPSGGCPDRGCEHLVIHDRHGDVGAFVYCRDDMHSPAHLVNGVRRGERQEGTDRDPNVALEVRFTAHGMYGVYVALRPLAAGTVLVSECWGPEFGRMSPPRERVGTADGHDPSNRAGAGDNPDRAHEPRCLLPSVESAGGPESRKREDSDASTHEGGGCGSDTSRAELGRLRNAPNRSVDGADTTVLTMDLTVDEGHGTTKDPTPITIDEQELWRELYYGTCGDGDADYDTRINFFHDHRSIARDLGCMQGPTVT